MKRISLFSTHVDSEHEESFIRDLRALRRIKILKQYQQQLPLSAHPSQRRPFVYFWISVESDLWPEARQLVTAYSPFETEEGGPSCREECVFTKRELDTAEMLAVRVDRSPLDYVGTDGGMIYDWTIRPADDNPAPWCWQKTPRLMKKKDLPKPHVGLHNTIPLEILIHKRLLDEVPGLKYEHVKLGPVLASGGSSEWFQLMADRVMPPYHEATTGIQTYTQEHAPPGSPRTIVSKSEEGYWPSYVHQHVVERFGSIPPMAFTHEIEGWWGIYLGPEPKPAPGDLSHQDAPPQPRLIVDQQTRRDLIAAGVKRLKFVPVRWVDDPNDGS